MRILQPLLNVSFTFAGNVSHWHEYPTFHALKVMTSTSLLYLLPHYILSASAAGVATEAQSKLHELDFLQKMHIESPQHPGSTLR